MQGKKNEKEKNGRGKKRVLNGNTSRFPYNHHVPLFPLTLACPRLSLTCFHLNLTLPSPLSRCYPPFLPSPHILPSFPLTSLFSLPFPPLHSLPSSHLPCLPFPSPPFLHSLLSPHLPFFPSFPLTYLPLSFLPFKYDPYTYQPPSPPFTSIFPLSLPSPPLISPLKQR